MIVDREPGGLDAPGVCRALRADPRLEDAWLLAITVAAHKRTADAALDAGADDYLHRPFSRAELLARARAGLRAAQQRADDALVRALMANVPGAIYRSAWHADFTLELISDEIERISGYPAANFIASKQRTLLSILHPDDREQVPGGVDQASPTTGRSRSSTGSSAPTARSAGCSTAATSSRAPAGGCGATARSSTSPSAARAEEALRQREIEHARTEELRASRARIVEAADAARRKIERDLHDGAQQRLVALALEVRMARSRVEKDPDAAAPLPRAHRPGAGRGVGRAARAGPRHPPRRADRARPGAGDRGARPTARRCRSRSSRCPRTGFPPAAEATAYFTVAEALTNVAKYADATHATVRLAQENGELAIEVRDDGEGRRAGDARLGARGPGGPRRRARRLARASSSPPGEGTLLRAVLPL